MAQKTHIKDKEGVVDADAMEAADSTKERGNCGIASSAAGSR